MTYTILVCPKCKALLYPWDDDEGGRNGWECTACTWTCDSRLDDNPPSIEVVPRSVADEFIAATSGPIGRLRVAYPEHEAVQALYAAIKEVRAALAKYREAVK